MFKKIVMYLGFFFFIVFIAGVILVGIVAFNGRDLDHSSKKYAQESIEKITFSWSKDELIARASPELLMATGKSEDFERLFNLLKKLGPLKKLGELKGESRVVYNIGRENVVTAEYITMSEFENEKATIRIKLIKKDNEWKISYINLNSDIFLKSMKP